MLEGGLGWHCRSCRNLHEGTLQKALLWYPGLEGLPGICSSWGEFPWVSLKKTIWLRVKFECVQGDTMAELSLGLHRVEGQFWVLQWLHGKKC